MFLLYEKLNLVFGFVFMLNRANTLAVYILQVHVITQLQGCHFQLGMYYPCLYIVEKMGEDAPIKVLSGPCIFKRRSLLSSTNRITDIKQISIY